MVSTPGKRHVPTPDTFETVRKLCVLGAVQKDIAAALEITIPTLRKHYRTTLRLGTMMACADVADALYRRALNASDPNDAAAPHAAKFFLARRAGWKEGDQAYDMDWCAVEADPSEVQELRAHRALQEMLSLARRAGQGDLARIIQDRLLEPVHSKEEATNGSERTEGAGE